MITGKSFDIIYKGKHLTVLNQRCREWDHPYDCVTPQQATLSSAGCGVFSVCHCGQWLTGKYFEPNDIADFSMQNGGRGDDGTDRPALLGAMMKKGLARSFGFRYEFDGLLNDADRLWSHLKDRRGVALCNLRPGHIVALLEARMEKEEKQALVLDSYSETQEEKVLPLVRQVIEPSAVVSPVRNEKGCISGYRIQYALYWASMETVRDYNLLHSL